MHRLAPWSFAFLVLSGCGTTASTATDGGSSPGADAAPKEPHAHRARATDCPSDRDAGAPITGPDSSACSKDSDCVAGTNGRCVSGATLATVCSYDKCVHDTDCGSAGVCDCRNTSAYGANVCFAGNCRIDGECGVGGYCSGSATDFSASCMTGIDPGAVGFFCHTPADTCTDDADCPPGSFTQKCIFDVGAGHWACVSQKCTL